MKRRTVYVQAKLDNRLAGKVDAIKAEGYGRLTEVIEAAIENYKTKEKPFQNPSKYPI